MTALNTTDWSAARALFAGGGLSVVLPCHDLGEGGEDGFLRLHDLLAGQGFPFQIVPVDDGSADGTPLAIRAAAARHPAAFTPILLPDNQGKGSAILAGLRAARHAWVLLLDGDFDLDPAALPAFCDVARATGADAVLGSKRHPASQVRYPAPRRLASALYHALTHALLGLSVSDTQCGMKLIRAEALRDAADRLLVKRFAFDLELFAALHAGGRTFAEAPVRLDFHARLGCLTPRTVWRTFLDTLAIAYRARVLHYYAALTPLPPIPAGEAAPRFSLIVACPGDSAVLRRLLDALRTQTYRRFELLLLPDAPLPDLPAQPYPVRLRPTGPARPANKRNRGAAAASGDILAFIDDDAYPRPDWLANAAARLAADASIDALGGPGLTPPDDPPRAQLSGAVLASPLVSGNFRHRYFVQGALRRVEDFPSCNLFVRASAFRAVGGFREDFWPGEDTLLCADLQRADHTLWYDPRVVVWHHRRPLFGPHLRQIGRYALHRGHFARRIGLNSRRLSYHLPSLFLIGLVGGAAVAPLSPWLAVTYLVTVGLYLLLTLADAIVEAPALRHAPALWLGIALTHLWYGARFIQGFLAPTMPDRPRPFDHR